MTNFDSNIVPGYSSWTKTNCTVTSSGDLSSKANGTAVWSRNVTDYSMSKYVRIQCGGCTGDFYLYFYYEDKEDGTFRVHHMPIPPSGISTVITPQEATTNHIYLQVVCSEAGTIKPISMEMLALGIRSVDIEYAQNTSKINPPTSGWSTTQPSFSTGKYIWQRTVTTFEDGTTAFSDPINIQLSNTLAIIDITDYYRLTSSNTTIPSYGESYISYWTTECPLWASGRFIWASSRLHWSDDSYTWTPPTLAKGLNDINEKTWEVSEDLKELDKSLDAEGVFNRLTDNGKVQGLYFETYNGQRALFMNATYIRSGEIVVKDTSNNDLFRAKMAENSVYIAGFTLSNKAMWYNTSYLKCAKHGVYLGIDGITTGDNFFHLTLTDGRVTAGKGDNAEDGYMDFRNYWTDTGQYGMRLAANGGIFFGTSRIGVLGYYSTSGNWTVSVGSNDTIYTINPQRINQIAYIDHYTTIEVLARNGTTYYTLDWPTFVTGAYSYRSLKQGLVI